MVLITKKLYSLKFWLIGICLLESILIKMSAYGMDKGAYADTIFVNNVIGKDDNTGLRAVSHGNDGPLLTIQRAFDVVGTSGYIHIENTGVKYLGCNRLSKGGVIGKPLVVEGNGSIICGLEPVPAKEWEFVEKDIYKRPFWPMSNQLKLNKEYQSWIGIPAVCHINNQALQNCNSIEELKRTSNSYWWNKSERTLLVHLPKGKKLTDVSISMPANRGIGSGLNVHGEASHIIINNLHVQYSYNDGFSAHERVKDLLFKNCISINNCGQGFSMHDQTEVRVEDAIMTRNASSGTCDVGAAKVSYKGCVIVNNSFEVGVYTHDAANVIFEDCMIIGNNPFEQLWQRGTSTMTLKNCVIKGQRDRTLGLVGQGKLNIINCTLIGANDLISFLDTTGKVTISNSLVRRVQNIVTSGHEHQLHITRSDVTSEITSGAKISKKTMLLYQRFKKMY